LAANRLTYPLFDSARFARHIESVYAAMAARQQSGNPPEHIHIFREADHARGG
jgi:protein O-GlcNAc transferase